jgi:4-hydroxy-3-methylbut-2-en-1-yl diphosphate synthase IspG/GcpE
MPVKEIYRDNCRTEHVHTAELTAAGCHIVWVAVPSQDDADALPAIAAKSQIPVIADIHFQPRYVFAAIDAGCAAVLVNPDNIKKIDDRIKQIALAATDAGVPIRIGVNAGSLDPRLLTKYGGAEALVESALWECSLFEDHGFRDIKISVKHHDPLVHDCRLPPAGRSLRLPPAPRRHRSRTTPTGHHQIRRRFRSSAG